VEIHSVGSLETVSEKDMKLCGISFFAYCLFAFGVVNWSKKCVPAGFAKNKKQHYQEKITINKTYKNTVQNIIKRIINIVHFVLV